MRSAFSLLTVPIIWLALPVAAQQQSVGHIPQRGGGGLSVRAVSAPTGSIEVDGRPDEAAWQRAEWLTDFVTKDPVEGGTPTERTEVAFLYDDDALYVAARLFTSDPAITRALVSRRDEDIGSADMFIVSFDTFRDRRTAYSLAVTAAGGRHDWYHPTDHEYDWDMSWDPVWLARTTRDSLGWYAELRIPFDQLRFNDVEEQVWGVNVNRWIPARNEDIFWTYVPRTETGWSSWMPALTGVRGIRPSTRLEVLPYVSTSTSMTGDRDVADPFDDGFREGARVGADFKMGLGPNLTLDAAVNPDFGQVEGDPAVVNLTAFETFFSERRPFFTEGSQLLQGGGRGYFYSRRIGASPFGRASGDYVDAPLASTILGAAKVTGRLASGLSVGALTAVTGSENARTFDVATNTEGVARVAPATGYGVVRVQQEFGPSQSTGGFILTAVERDMDAAGPLAGLVARRAYTGGTDWRLRFNGGRWEIRGNAGFSYLQGDSSAILRQQVSSRRYFQRPDADYVSVDPSRTSLTGWAASIGIEKNTGRLLAETGLSLESPNFEINDLGRLGATDDVDWYGELRWRQTQPGSWYRSWSVGTGTYLGWNFGGVRTGGESWAYVNLQLPNYLRLGMDAGRGHGAQSDAATRGGPLMRVGTNWWVSADANTNFAARTQFGVDISGFWSETGSRQYSLGTDFRFKPSGRLTLSVAPRYSQLTEARQYVAARPNGPVATFGTRYLFGVVERTQVSTQLRLNYAVTPDLTVELYAEPFAANGDYGAVGELTEAGENTLRVYGTDNTTLTESAGVFTVSDAANGDTFSFGNPDFTFRSFRSNVVVRWEWRPGSTLFLVWQQNRGDFLGTGARVGPRDLWDALRASGDNFLAVKLSYWIG